MFSMPGMYRSPTSSQPSSEEGSNLSARVTRIVRKEMGDTWRHDAKFFKKFFPVGSNTRVKSAEIKHKLYNFQNGRWKGISPKVKSVATLSTRLLHLLNGILKDTDLSKTRTFFKTKPIEVSTGRETFTTPSLFLAGSGNEFINIGVNQPFAQYAQGLSPFEVRLESPDSSQGQGRLAVHALETFSDQENRRFLFGVVLTEHTMSVFMFDHSGVLVSDPLDYHANAEQFCAVILGLASKDAISLGFDPTMYRQGLSPKISTFQSDEDHVRRTRRNVKTHGNETIYTIKIKHIRFRSVVGKGTLCWLTQDDRTKEEYVIKDSWVPHEELPGRESEASLLWHAQRMGLVRGIAQIRHSEEVRIGRNGAVDTIMHNRRLRGPVDHTIERVHTRLVLSTYGKPLDEFTSPREFLLAYHDAVLAHRNLYETAGILHRDISVRNILIKKDGVEGDRGVLIDFDNAIRVGDTSPYSTKKKIGTWLYKSRNIILEKEPHTYVDDLESFYWVLCWTVVAYMRPGVPRSPLPVIVKGWGEDYAWSMKHGHIVTHFDLPTSPWFGNSIRQLCIRLHSFFHTRDSAQSDAFIENREMPALDPSKDYEDYLAQIRQAISELEDESLLPVELPLGDHEDGPHHSEKRTTVTKRRKAPNRQMLPPVRPRRTTAKYA